MIEYGIFNDEGLLEGQFYSQAAAEEARSERYSDDEWAEVAEICPDHEGQRRDSCEECDAELEEEDDDE